ncbi:MAG: glutathione binding-like protein [Sulfuricaulis sp.]|uniref:glutathione binding-like protein n=1 Tax=Sulfuricaulis sp. TaxID=2003553 RepID=UPI0034A2CC01
MIDLYYWTTPNGHKIAIFLEETGLPYALKPVDIGKGSQFEAAFLKISPNNRIPAIVDHQPVDNGAPISVFESGAILQYLAEKTGLLLPQELRARTEVMQWLFWQMGNLGPLLGQNHHFVQYAPEKIPYAIERYVKEAERLYSVLDHRLADREFIAGEYSIADIAAYPWTVSHRKQKINLDEFPHAQRWFQSMKARPAVIRAYEIAKQVNTAPVITDASRSVLFGQGKQPSR